MTLSNIFNSITSFIGDGISGIGWWISFIWNEVHILYIIGFVIVIVIFGGLNTITFRSKFAGNTIKMEKRPTMNMETK